MKMYKTKVIFCKVVIKKAFKSEQFEQVYNHIKILIDVNVGPAKRNSKDVNQHTIKHKQPAEDKAKLREESDPEAKATRRSKTKTALNVVRRSD